MKPVMAAAAASTEAREGDLVASAQAGNQEAFEALFRRYRDRITSFVRASVRDDGRTEDLVQEIFFAAHSSLATLGSPAAFRSWLYQIARNACLDEARRRSRQDELIYGWDEFPPPDERIMFHGQDADRTLNQKEELANLTQALDGLPDSQHDALVMRELEGRSYDEIGRRMRLSRTAVESVLFRARRGLKGEYAEIATGERCTRMQGVMAQVSDGGGDLRERRKLIRHMRDCGRCRRDAAALGLSGLAVPSDDRHGLERVFSRVAAFLPLPAFFSRRADQTDQLAGGSSFAAQAQGAAAQFSAVGADHAVSAVHKVAAVVAAVAVVGGGGVVMKSAGVDLPLKLPVIGSIMKDDHSKAAAAGGSVQSGELPPAANGGGDGAPAPGGPLSAGGAAQQDPGAAAVGLDPLTTGTGPLPAAGTAPAAGDGLSSPGALAPDATDPAGTAPSGDNAPASGDGTQPAGGTDTKTKGSKGSGSPDTGGSGSGSGSESGSSSGGASSPPLKTPAGEPIPQTLPPGVQKQLESGKRTLDDLPPGQKKKLAVPVETTTVTTP